jgi:hypothetical protein
MFELCATSQEYHGFLFPNNIYNDSAKRKQRLENSYPKRTSGFGTEGWEEGEEMTVWA